MSCTQLHPGLCVSRDVGFYDQTITGARNVERALAEKGDVFGFYKLCDLDKVGPSDA